MIIAPINSSSLSIGTPTRDRAPPSFADGPETVSAASSGVGYLLCPHDTIEKRGIRSRLKRSAPPWEFSKFQRRTNLRRHVEQFAIEAVQRAKFGLADTRCILQHGL